MNVNRLGVEDDADVLVEPPPDVRLEIVGPDGDTSEVTLSLNVPISQGGLTFRLAEVIKRQPRRPTPNGKNHYTITADDGTEHVEYVRSEERAVELFQKKHPDKYIRSVSVQ